MFGNLTADALTTGPGTYAHSLLSVFSHLGLVGAALFTMYLVALYREIMLPPIGLPSFYSGAKYPLFRAMILGGLIGYGLIGTFFTWMPLWFALGLLFPPLISRPATRPGYSPTSARTARTAASPVP